MTINTVSTVLDDHNFPTKQTRKLDQIKCKTNSFPRQVTIPPPTKVPKDLVDDFTTCLALAFHRIIHRFIEKGERVRLQRRHGIVADGLKLAARQTTDGIMTRVPQMTRDAYLIAHLPTPLSYYCVFVHVALERVWVWPRAHGLNETTEVEGRRRREDG